MSESPNEEAAALWLDRDIAVWLHEVADKRYDGDLQAAMNDMLRTNMIAEQAPADAWAAVSWKAQQGPVAKRAPGSSLGRGSTG